MIVVDSSVWIDYLTGRPSRQADWLDIRLNRERILVGDLILAEVLQGCDSDRDFDATLAEMSRFSMIEIGGELVVIEAARHYRALRARGITVRKTIDTLIATRCIIDDIALLYSDRDFDPFVAHLGLRSAFDTPGAN